jgi:hypothetical protein
MPAANEMLAVCCETCQLQCGMFRDCVSKSSSTEVARSNNGNEVRKEFRVSKTYKQLRFLQQGSAMGHSAVSRLPGLMLSASR